MKKLVFIIYFFIFIFLNSNSIYAKVKIGDPKSKVLSTLGYPNGKAKFGNYLIWHYDTVKIKFKHDIIIQIDSKEKKSKKTTKHSPNNNDIINKISNAYSEEYNLAIKQYQSALNKPSINSYELSIEYAQRAIESPRVYLNKKRKKKMYDIVYISREKITKLSEKKKIRKSNNLKKIKDAMSKGKVSSGMTKDQVLLMWGKPKQVSKTITEDNIFETWRYSKTLKNALNPVNQDIINIYLNFKNDLLSYWSENSNTKN